MEKLNSILHEYSNRIVGRMGMPYSKKSINIITIVIDAPQDEINTLSGKIGKLSGITSKVIYSNWNCGNNSKSSYNICFI